MEPSDWSNLWTGLDVGTNLVGQGINGIMSFFQRKRLEQREDNAVQRRMADLRNAGLNPLLSVGGNVSAAGASSVQPFQFDGNLGTQEKYLNRLNTSATVEELKARIEEAKARTKSIRIANKYDKWRNEYWQNTAKIPHDSNNNLKLIMQALGFIPHDAEFPDVDANATFWERLFGKSKTETSAPAPKSYDVSLPSTASASSFEGKASIPLMGGQSAFSVSQWKTQDKAQYDLKMTVQSLEKKIGAQVVYIPESNGWTILASNGQFMYWPAAKKLSDLVPHMQKYYENSKK